MSGPAWVVLVLVIVAVALVVLVLVQRRRRSGGVIAGTPSPRRRKAQS